MLVMHFYDQLSVHGLSRSTRKLRVPHCLMRATTMEVDANAVLAGASGWWTAGADRRCVASLEHFAQARTVQD